MRLEESIEIEVACDELFALSQDYARRLEWDPFLRRAELWGAAPGVGVRAWCESSLGFGMETEYVSFELPRATAVKMTRGPLCFARFAGSWLFESLSDGGTTVRFIYSFESRPRIVSGLLNGIIAHWLRRDMVRRLEAMKRFAENPGSIKPRVLPP